MKYNLLALFLLVYVSCHSQKIGINLSTSYTFYSMNAGFKDPSFVPALGIGFTYRKSLNERSAIVTGLDYQNFHYQASMTAISQSGTTNSFSARVINGMFQVPLLYEYNFKTEKLSPFIRFGLMAHGTIISGINSRIIRE